MDAQQAGRALDFDLLAGDQMPDTRLDLAAQLPGPILGYRLIHAREEIGQRGEAMACHTHLPFRIHAVKGVGDW